jgi:hypothetical protein
MAESAAQRSRLIPLLMSGAQPVTSYPSTYAEMNREARDAMSAGASRMMAPDAGLWGRAKGAGVAGLGALEFVSSPVNAALRTVVGEPIAQNVGVPREYSELAVGMGIPGAGAARAGRAGRKALPMDEASRMARAEQMGFRLDTPAEFGRAPKGERIAGPAVQISDGRIFTGANHPAILLEAERTLGIPAEKLVEGVSIPDGFLTTAGRFVSRHEAHDIAQRAGDLVPGHPSARGLTSAIVRQATESAPTATAPVRTAATAPGLPGGQGLWGRLLQGEDAAVPPAGALFPRYEHLGRFDASKMQDYEIRATLAGAWDDGFDAVKIDNYTRPGATKPENLLIVREPNQLREQGARFDPKKRLSPDVKAGLAGLSIPAAYAYGTQRE